MKVLEEEEEEVGHVGCDEGTHQVERNDAAADAFEARETLEIGEDSTSKLGCMLLEPSRMKSCTAPKPQKKSTFCGEQCLEEKDHTNLMEQMIAEAGDAKASKYLEEQERRKHFGKGLKTGFLNTPKNTSASKTRQRKILERKKEMIENIPQVPKPNAANSLILEEVQEAMKPTDISAAEQMLANEGWADESFTKRIMARPNLAAAMATQEFRKALELMKEDPKKLKIMLEHNPRITELYKELMMLLLEHFQELGKKEERTVAKELGPLAEKAILKHQMMSKDKKQKNKETPPNSGVEEDLDDHGVSNILANPNLRSLLEDKELQRVISECSDPKTLRMHMNNPAIREKIMQLADAGLIAIQ